MFLLGSMGVAAQRISVYYPIILFFLTKTTVMPHSTRPDRLSALVSRFQLVVTAANGQDANLAIDQRRSSQSPDHIIFAPFGKLSERSSADSVRIFNARVEWGGNQNPLVNALPSHMHICIENDAETRSLASLLVSEHRASRCGSETVINRLGEVLVVRLLRSRLSSGSTDVGLLAGLSDERLSPAIVAMHEQPGRLWSIDRLAQHAGLSASRFAERFTRTVGKTPMSYLRHWRMILAHQDLQKGERVQLVADRYGYTSGEALTRAFRRQYGYSPSQLWQ